MLVRCRRTPLPIIKVRVFIVPILPRAVRLYLEPTLELQITLLPLLSI